MKHYELAPGVWHEKPLVFDWDISTGEVTGPDAARILALAVPEASMPAHPSPWLWYLSAEPTKNMTDMAAILGWSHQLPAELLAAYPVPEEEGDVDADDDVPSVEVVY